jgi:hypothetical protein
VNERVQHFDDHVIKVRAAEHERTMLAAAAEVGCAPPFTLVGHDAIRMPRLTVLTKWLETASADDKQMIAHSLIACIERLHCAGICHRDVHRENIVLDGARPLLIDFELSAGVDPSCPCYDLLGPASGVPLPSQHEFLGLVHGIWWDSTSSHVRQLWRDLGRLAEIRAS